MQENSYLQLPQISINTGVEKINNSEIAFWLIFLRLDFKKAILG